MQAITQAAIEATKAVVSATSEAVDPAKGIANINAGPGQVLLGG